MRTPRTLLAAFGLAVVVDLASLAVGFEPGHTVAKPLLMPLLAAWAALRGAPRLLVVALLFGWGGDTLLLSDAEPAFLAGMASFAVGHVCYLALFRAHGRRNTAPRARTGLIALGYAAALTGTVALLWPDLPAGLRVPVAAYSALLTAMAYGALTRLGLLAGLGGALFMLSDTLIATGVADWPQLPGPDFWIMLTYIAAQFLLTRGTLGVRHTTQGAPDAGPGGRGEQRPGRTDDPVRPGRP
ncbi:lysoplasmalogenase [Streptomyces sp. TRM72054]|uniref:lysoplasmalogenase n=1 Tax=Streptomyces sp. TRM72054 TaxID=2870562 RepID=UPI001C8C5F38|nr:lysoplasmalogenase [Streptomyces sp. TRM72054]MBX9393538.1 lysoplasmalogenase [Streptomyces sp. TRM72054]